METTIGLSLLALGLGLLGLVVERRSQR